MNFVKFPNRSGGLKLEPGGGWRVVAAALVVGVSAIALSGCWAIPPNVLTTQGNPVPVAKIFPSALLAEPIQLRAGHTHTTQLFRIKDPRERWAVAMGFVRTDEALTSAQRLGEDSNTCWTDNPQKSIRLRTCKVNSPGLHLRWELLREDGSIASQYEFDTLDANSGGTYAANAITSAFSGFSNQKMGAYRLRVSVLRDAKELDFLKPHILVNRPFFSSRSIE
jgi:hypothetical protein